MLTPTRAVQAFIDSKKENREISEEIWANLKTYRKWNEVELLGLRNASAFYPDIFFEEGMEDTISKLVEVFHSRIVPHKF